MFELLGSETEHEAAVKRTINLQEQIIENYNQITQCYAEIRTLEEENEILENALKHWKEEVEKYYNAFGHTNLVADLSGATLTTKQEIKKKKKPTTK